MWRRLLALITPRPVEGAAAPAVEVPAPQDTKDGGRAALVAVLRAVEMAEPERWAAALARPCQTYAIRPGKRLAAFAATIAHESNGGRQLVENMSYSADRIRAVWPSRFPTPESAAPFARNPIGLANRVYGGRMGNTQADDGWRFIGRGLIHITGRANYTRAGAALGLPLADLPDLAAEPEAAAQIAAWWWASNGCNELADAGEVEPWRKRVNGGLIGLADVRRRYQAALSVGGA